MPDKVLAALSPKTDDPVDARFWEFCQGRELRFQQCGNCGAWRHRPRHICAHCGSSRCAWSLSAGRGRVFSWTVTHQPFHEAFVEDLPIIAAIVDLDEGVRMATRLVEIAPAEIALDMPVVLEFCEASGGLQLPCFKPAAD